MPIGGGGRNDAADASSESGFSWVSDVTLVNESGRQTPETATPGKLKMSPPRARNLAKVASHIISNCAKGEDCLIVGFGTRAKIEAVLKETKADAEARQDMRVIVVRELIHLVCTA